MNSLSKNRLPRAAGVGLVELLIGLAIGTVVIAGAVFVYSQSRNTYAMNESTARLQEEGRFVLAMIEPDVQLSGYYGFTNAADDVQLEGGVAASNMQQADPPRPELPPTAHECGRNFAVDLIAGVQGSNDAFVLGPNRAAACDPQGGGARPNTDTLTIRRASAIDLQPADLQAGRLQIVANRLGRASHTLFLDGTPPIALNPSPPDPVLPNQVVARNLVVRTFYISNDSNGRPGFPALRIKFLGTDGAQPIWTDQELMPGVEDLQVQFGIDTGDYNNDGVIDNDVGNDGWVEGNGLATRYVNPDSPLLPQAQIASVRLWLRLRADQPEQGFIDGRNYQYANVNYTPAGAERNFRRVLVSRTINLRNARTL